MESGFIPWRFSSGPGSSTKVLLLSTSTLASLRKLIDLRARRSERRVKNFPDSHCCIG